MDDTYSMKIIYWDAESNDTYDEFGNVVYDVIGDSGALVVKFKNGNTVAYAPGVWQKVEIKR